MALHLTVYHCEVCDGPVVSALAGDPGPVAGAGPAARGNPPAAGVLVQLGKPTCLECGRIQDTLHGKVLEVPPQQWS